jgi:hypothetical protein
MNPYGLRIVNFVKRHLVVEKLAIELQTQDNSDPARKTKRKHLIIRSYSSSCLGYGKQM